MSSVSLPICSNSGALCMVWVVVVGLLLPSSCCSSKPRHLVNLILIIACHQFATPCCISVIDLPDLVSLDLLEYLGMTPFFSLLLCILCTFSMAVI